MSHVPRRTSEFQLASERTSMNPRPSRIAQPAGPSSAMRNHFARASATPSMGRMTPMRTPSRDRNTLLMPQTAEKEKPPVDDKVFIQAKNQQVMEELCKFDGFNELIQKGLKTMTHKQFIMILQLFLKPIVGVVRLDGSNYIDYTYNLLATLDYPYAGLSKSSMKTPTAPHCHNSIILLLAWLVEFNNSDFVIGLTTSEDFNSPELSGMFMQKTGETFELWNSNKEAESEEVKDQIRQRYIEQKTGNSGDLDGEVSRLKRTIDEMMQEAKPASLQKQVNDKREESKRLSQTIKQLENENSEISGKIKSACASLEAKRASMKSLDEEYQEEQKKLAKQKMTVEQKNEMLVQLSQYKARLAQGRATHMELSEASSEKEIQLSNLIQKKFLLFDKLNNFIYMLSSDLKAAGMHGDFDPSKFEIKKTKIGVAAALEKELDRLQQGLEKLSANHRHELENVEKALMELDAKKHKIAIKNEKLTREVEKLKISLDEARAEESQLENELKVYMKSSEETCQKYSAEIKSMTEEIEDVKLKIEQLRQRNAEILEKKSEYKKSSVETCRKYHEKRKAEVEEHRKKLRAINKEIDEIMKVIKPIPDEVLKLVDQIRKRKNDVANKEN